jgi:hypothetical protein
MNYRHVPGGWHRRRRAGDLHQRFSRTQTHDPVWPAGSPDRKSDRWCVTPLYHQCGHERHAGAGAAGVDQVIRAVEFLFGFTLAAGLVWCCLPPSPPPRGTRIRHHARRGRRASLLQVTARQLAGVGLLAGFLASMVARWWSARTARYVFDFNWTGSLDCAGVLAAWPAQPSALTANWWGIRIQKTPVVETLHQAR